METKKPYITKKPGILKTLNVIVGAITYLVKVGKAGKITPFKNVEFYFDSGYVSDWKQDKKNQIFKKEIEQKMIDEMKKFVDSR